MTDQERYSGITPFKVIYDSFFTLVTDDMYLEWYEDETQADVRNILLAALPKFEYPRFKIYDYTLVNDDEPEILEDQFNFVLDREEINILTTLMMIEWFTRQIATADITKQKYSSSDFKFTSQANHLAKLLELRKTYRTDVTYLQRLYGRRRVNSDGIMRPNFSGLGGKAGAN